MRTFAAAFAVAITLSAAGAASAASTYAGVIDGSTQTATARVMKLSAVIAAPRAVLWRALVDPVELKKWNSPVAFTDIRPGGYIEASYNKTARLGDPQNIRNEIVAVEPERMLVFRNVQAPNGLPGRERFGHIVSTAEFEEVGAGQTRVTLWQVGYGAGADDKPLYDFFHNGNAYLLANMNHVYAGGPKPEQPDGH